MIEVRRKETIFHMDEGWVSGYRHFSFDRYRDPENERFGTLRVFNVDTLAPGEAWPMHPHRDIEVVTYCAEGEFQHADSLDTGGVLLKGHAMHTTVGRGISHSEINHRIWSCNRGGLPMMDGGKLNNLMAELECLGLELANIEAQVSKIRAEIAELSLSQEAELDDLVPVPVYVRKRTERR